LEFLGNERIYAGGLIPSLREIISSLSEFMREIKFLKTAKKLIEKIKAREY
jgi:hypothetical protein